MARFTLTGVLRFRRFATDESGAVTVDWVVLTAAVVGLSLLVFSIVTNAIFADAATNIGAVIASASSH